MLTIFFQMLIVFWKMLLFFVANVNCFIHKLYVNKIINFKSRNKLQLQLQATVINRMREVKVKDGKVRWSDITLIKSILIEQR